MKIFSKNCAKFSIVKKIKSVNKPFVKKNMKIVKVSKVYFMYNLSRSKEMNGLYKNEK